jgi:hypothetical protein
MLFAALLLVMGMRDTAAMEDQQPQQKLDSLEVFSLTI